MGIVFRFDLVSSDAYLELSQEDSIFFRLFLVYSTITVAIFLFGVAERFFRTQKSILEFSIMVFCIHVGGLFALRLHTFMDILLALEIVTLASYALITFERQNRFSTYAGVQYFILGSLPSAFLILSFGLFYLQGGSIAIQDLDLIFNTFYTSSDFLQVNDAINFL
jgi:NADH-quinone oxidoreductase subunit N